LFTFGGSSYRYGGGGCVTEYVGGGVAYPSYKKASNIFINYMFDIVHDINNA
jgi:hypothetical protein